MSKARFRKDAENKKHRRFKRRRVLAFSGGGPKEHRLKGGISWRPKQSEGMSPGDFRSLQLAMAVGSSSVQGSKFKVSSRMDKLGTCRNGTKGTPSSGGRRKRRQPLKAKAKFYSRLKV